MRVFLGAPARPYDDLDGAAARILTAPDAPIPQPTRKPHMDNWLPTLITPPRPKAMSLAVDCQHMAIKKTQPDAAVRDRLRPDYPKMPMR